MTIFDYTDYRSFLNDYYHQQKKLNSKFSYRYFARLAKFKSSATLKLVIESKRNLSTKMVQAFAKAIHLNAKETSYFETLVLFNQTQNPTDKNHYLDRLLRLKPGKLAKGIHGATLKYYSKKHYVVIREMVALPNFKENYTWIANQLFPAITESEAKEAVEALLSLNLLKRDKTGKLVHSDMSLSTTPNVSSPEVFSFQRDMINNALNALMLLPEELRDISSITVPIPLSKLDDIKDMLRDFQIQLLNYINECGDSKFDGVYQFNFQCFPVTKIESK